MPSCASMRGGGRSTDTKLACMDRSGPLEPLFLDTACQFCCGGNWEKMCAHQHAVSLLTVCFCSYLLGGEDVQQRIGGKEVSSAMGVP